MRRSLTITPENDKKILLAKGSFLTGDTPVEIDYTTLVNIFLELGDKVFCLTRESRNSAQVVLEKIDVFNVFKKYVLSPELKEDAIGDQFTEIWYKKMVAQSRKTEKADTQPDAQKPSSELPNQKSSSSNTEKTPDYVS